MGKIHINIPARSIGRSAAADAWLDQFATRERIMNDVAKVKPDIAAMTMSELAEYVVTLDLDWDIARGAKMQYGRLGRCDRVVRYCETGAESGVAELFFERLGWVPVSRVCIYLDDPATLGCLLAMVRARHGSESRTTCSIDGVWGFVAGRPDCHELICEIKSPTEAHALVAALAKGAS